jgi:hypothetical protein
MAKIIRYTIEPRKIQFDGRPVARLLPRIGLNGAVSVKRIVLSSTKVFPLFYVGRNGGYAKDL